MKNIILIGMMGSGKTTIGELLSHKLSKDFIDMDDYIEKSNHMTIQDMFSISEEYFRDQEMKACKELSQKEDTIISTGGGVIKNQKNIDYLKENGIIIYLDRPINDIMLDIDISHRPLLKNGKEELEKLYQERHDLYSKSAHYRINNDQSIDYVLEKIEEIIKNAG